MTVTTCTRVLYAPELVLTFHCAIKQKIHSA